MTEKEWNDTYPIGQLIEYVTHLGASKSTRFKTSSKAGNIHGTPVICLEGRNGFFALSNCKPILDHFPDPTKKV